MSTQIQQAIALSLEGNWDSAIDLNLSILESNPTDIATLNRLAKCYIQIGDKKSAKDTYERVLAIDKYNAVALKNIKNISVIGSINLPELCREDFIENPGLTKSSSLIKVADRAVLATLTAKQELKLVPKTRLVSVTTMGGTYVGTLPDDLSLKLKKLLAAGYAYQTCLKNAVGNAASIFIREIKRPKKPGSLPSFRAHAVHPLA